MGIVINRVYTKQGDAGSTRLAGGQSLSKTDARICAYGSVDELNATIGVALTFAVNEGGSAEPAYRSALEVLCRRLGRVQHELFDLGGELATLPEDRHAKQILISDEDVVRLESEMDEDNESLPPLRSFVLPGGGLVSAQLHVSRTVCRRAERDVLRLHEQAAQRPEVIRYLNRLSDWLFVLGRTSAVKSGAGEALWEPGSREV